MCSCTMSNDLPLNCFGHLDKMNVDRNIKLPDLISLTLLLSKTDVGLRRFFHKLGTLFELCDLKNGGSLRSLDATRQP